MYRILLSTIFIFLVSFADLSGQATQLWGVTKGGGEYNAGTVFITNADGYDHIIAHSFQVVPGEFPRRTGLVEASNGLLYGLTSKGGIFDDGILYSFDPQSGNVVKLVDFEEDSLGELEDNYLTLIGDKLYGTAHDGGGVGSGTLFEYDINTQEFEVLFEFGGSTGGVPKGKLTVGESGNLYGICTTGGPNQGGTIYEFDLETNEFTLLKFFGGSFALQWGEYLEGWLVEYDGLLIGVAEDEGENGLGCIFEYNLETQDIEGTFHFSGELGFYPKGGLVAGDNGNYYLLLQEGGTTGSGTIIEYNPVTKQGSKVYEFTEGDGNGYYPCDGLIHNGSNVFYGLTKEGGTNERGVLFEFDANTYTFTKKFDMLLETGSFAQGQMMKASNGKFYGVSAGGYGQYGHGVIYSYDPISEQYNAEARFQEAPDGSSPIGGLTKVGNYLYGATENGGVDDKGTLYRINLETNEFEMIFEFPDNAETGENPSGQLLLASDGYLYGTTKRGGTYFKGVFYQLNPTTLEVSPMWQFGLVSERNPYGHLIEASNGKIYGLTESHDFALGSVYVYDPEEESLDVLEVLSGSNQARTPRGSLMEASNGLLYGMTVFGSDPSNGVIFTLDPETETYSELFLDFVDEDGKHPYGNLVEYNGQLYGMTRDGIEDGMGTLFSYSISENTYDSEFQFDGENGEVAFGNLILSSDNIIFGTTAEGGENDLGTLFSFDPMNGTHTLLLHFNGENGSGPEYSRLLEVLNPFVGLNEQKEVNDLTFYPNPTAETLNVESHRDLIKTIEIRDISGRLIHAQDELNDFMYRWNDSLESGVYLISVITSSGKKVTKRVVWK